MMLAYGYANVDMYDESFNMLAGLMAEDLTRDESAAVHKRLGLVHYRTKSLEKALFHYRQAAESQRVPRCQMPGIWVVLADVAFEMGRFEEAAEYAENWRAANEAVHPKYRNVLPLAPKEVLLMAKFWSHVERNRALAYVDMAMQDASHDFDAATLAWIQRLREGEAPAEIPPMERPWLAKPTPSLSTREVMRRVEVYLEGRRRLTRPTEQPAALAREEWVSDWQRATTLDAIMLPPAADDVAVELEAPVLPPPSAREEAEEDVLEAGHRDADQVCADGSSANARSLIR